MRRPTTSPISGEALAALRDQARHELAVIEAASARRRAEPHWTHSTGTDCCARTAAARGE